MYTRAICQLIRKTPSCKSRNTSPLVSRAGMGLKDITREPCWRFWMLLASRTIMGSSKSKEATYTTPASFLRTIIVRPTTGWRRAYVLGLKSEHVPLMTGTRPARECPVSFDNEQSYPHDLGSLFIFLFGLLWHHLSTQQNMNRCSSDGTLT